MSNSVKIKKLCILVSFAVIVMGGFFFFNRAEERKVISDAVAEKFESKRLNLQKTSALITRPAIAPTATKYQNQNSPSLDRSNIIEQAVSSFNKHSESMEPAWQSYRIGVYKNIGVEGADLMQLDQILKEHLALLEEIQNEIRGNKSDGEIDALSVEARKVYASMDKQTEEYLGRERFLYVQEARLIFNKAFQRKTKSNTEYIGW